MEKVFNMDVTQQIKDVVSWGRWVCQCEGIQELKVDFSILNNLNGEILIQASQHDFELMLGYNLGHIFYAHLTDFDCDKTQNSMLPLTVEEYNQAISDDTFIPLCNDQSTTDNAHVIDSHSECYKDHNTTDNAHVIDNHSEYYNFHKRKNFTESRDKINQKHFESQYYEKDYYNCDKHEDCDYNGNIGDLDLSDDHLPDLNVLGAYSELESSATEKDHRKDIVSCEQNSVQNVLSQDLYKKIETKSRRKERHAKNWEFLVRLLADPRTNPELVSWVDQSKGTFRLVQPHVVVSLWNAKSNKTSISYNSFARGLRYHYKTGALFLVAEQQLMYGCGQEALNYLQEILNQNSKPMCGYR